MTACFDGSLIFFDTISTRVQCHVFAARLRGLTRAVFVLDAFRLDRKTNNPRPSCFDIPTATGKLGSPFRSF